MADQALDLDIGATAGRFVTPALRQRIESIVLGTATIALLLVVWELLPHVLPIQQGTRLFFTVPSRIFATLWQMCATGTIWAPLGVSAMAFAVGLALLRGRPDRVLRRRRLLTLRALRAPAAHPVLD
jgi:hypothetical protein